MKIKNALKMIVLLMIGGTIYFCIEMLWRGHSHWTMALVGGICFIAIGAINEYIPWEMGMVQQLLIGACLVTGIEFIAGLILNVWLGLAIWDYSNLPFNIMRELNLSYLFSLLGLLCLLLRLWLMIIYDIGFLKRKNHIIN